MLNRKDLALSVFACKMEKKGAALKCGSFTIDATNDIL